MLIREYAESDFYRIKELHKESKIDYILPEFSPTEFFSRRVVSDGEGLGMAAFLKLTAEAYLVCNPSWRGPAWRFEALRQLSTQCNVDAKKAGVVEVCAFLPPTLTKAFGRRLSRLGWGRVRNDWQVVYKAVE